MTTSTCSRNWEGEASRDGRLSDDDIRSFEQHCATCASCREVVGDLAALTARMRAAAPGVDEMAVRRLRQRVLRNANDLVLSRSPAQQRRWRVGAFTLVPLALALGLLTYALSEHSSVSGPQANSAALVALAAPSGSRTELLAQAAPGAIWSRMATSGGEELSLSAGILSIEVRHAAALGSNEVGAPQPRVIVRVPDGEILDLGTRFRVVVEHDRTVEISVSEGAVLLRRAGLADVKVERGSTWRLHEDLSSVASSSTPNANLPGARPLDQLPVAPARTSNHSQRRAAPPAPTTNGGNAPELSEEAERAAEDAAYLQWIGLLRAGRRNAAQRAGLEYLQRFPNAFRRAEVQAVVAPLGVPAIEPVVTPER